jgi:hypothetical protein
MGTDRYSTSGTDAEYPWIALQRTVRADAYNGNPVTTIVQ